MSCSHPGLNACGCCEHPEQTERYNRPGLAEIAYRLGTHSSFLHQMSQQVSLAELDSGPHAGSRPLAALGTRRLDDPSMALLDSASMMFDVLTFYQERIANEGFLGTATERLSVLEMARAIGYELSPGVAADVTLVFTLDETPGKAPSQSKIAARTRVQSLPANGDLPQTFETVNDFTAYKAWNQLKPRALFDQVLSISDAGTLQRMTISGGTTTATRIAVTGTSLLIEAGDLLVAHIDGRTTILRVTGVEEHADIATTQLEVALPAGAVPSTPPLVLSALGTSVVPVGPIAMTDSNIAAVLDASYSESDLQILLEDREWEVDTFLEAVNAPPSEDADSAADPLNGLFVLRQRVAMFGHNSQPWDALPVTQREGEYARVADASASSGYTYDWLDGVYSRDWDNNTVWEDPQGTDYTDADLFLERDVDEVLDEGWLVLDGRTNGSRSLRAYRIDDKMSASLAEYGLSGKVTGLDVSDPDGSAATKATFRLRKTTAHVASEWLELADLEITDAVAGSTIELDRMVLGFTKDQDVVVGGELADPEGVIGTEVATIKEINHQYGRTTLTFTEDLTNDYLRHTVTIYGNVVRATHGQTVEQALGSGDGSLVNQTFELSTSPLTYVSAATATGREPTLELRVNGRLWDEVRSLYSRGPAEQIYTVRIADDATATVTLGDGIAGARPATGTENITARYRTGIGPEGEVDAETIQLLMTRPPGVKTVNNPLPAAGAEAPETYATARQNAPMTVRTLDRVVSLSDFEDFAATFAGIGKARADVLRLHGQRLVHITVGSSSGGEVTAEKIALLVTAINNVRDPGEAVCVSSYRPLSFDLHGSVKTDPKLVHDVVMAEVTATLRDAFSFEARRFAQGASVAEVMSVIHRVGGVVATDIDQIEVKGGSGTTITVPPLGIMVSRPARLMAGATALGCDSVEAADLLLINHNGIELGVMA